MPTDKLPIGFGRKPDPDPNGTGDGWRMHSGDAEPDKPQGPERPARSPLVEPKFVDDLVATEILQAYGIFPLVPLGKLEHQLLQVIEALEERIRELDPALRNVE